MRRCFFTCILLCCCLPALFAQQADTIHRPKYYAYGEAFGPGGYFSVNIERRFLSVKHGMRGWYARGGFQWLPDLSARYTMNALAGAQFDSGDKNWSRNFGIGCTFMTDHYNWQRSGELSSHTAEEDGDPTFRWGPYLSLGLRYRFDNELFCGFEFTPLVLSGNDGFNLIPYAGICAGFLLDPKKD